MRRVEKILPTALDDELVRLGHAQTLFKQWEEIVGPGLAQRSWPDRYGKGVVWVAVQGSAWAQELRLRKEMILERLRAASGDPAMFKDVRFGVRKLPEKLEPVQEEPTAPAEELSIRDIAERRLKKWRNEGPA
ncbi:MAG TPA: DUF721 domain-containing protein [Fimbriimonas sp.]|nr:DUF721 domain-containing protein [Fimbriimonas sp.]